jgi:uroporphyrinogen decarboxylase
LTDGSPCLVPEAFEETREDGAEIAIKYQGQRAARRSPESLYFDVCWAPLANAQTPAEIDAFRWPDPWTPREEDFVRRQIQELHHGTDKALFAGLPLLVGSFFEISLVLFGFENFMMMLAGDRDLVEHWLDFKLAHDLEILGKFLAVAGPYLAAIQMCDDFGAQDSLQISPGLYREVFKPRQRKWIEFVKARTSAKVFLHSDGAIAQILPDLIEIGVDILNPLQTSAAGMDARRIKAEYGRDLSFWGGGVDTQTTLPFGSVDDIKREARERLEILAPGGGFVFAPIHNIQPDISPEKVLAIYETAAAWGGYPKR